MKEYTITLEEDEVDILLGVLEDALHQNTAALSIEDAILRGVLTQMKEQENRNE